ncbi:hypothetical protein BKA66DRAFT_444695 [Pyrenochaeta sp. MPI-SDFR-AT-0127]|nr:hypothetical protein BKA66DRAFT_444695 [Pyrenochaeta sp. MPI-SDFR-AT-0127]
MAKLRKRLCRKPHVQRHCHILAAPAEIRLAVYQHITQQVFLPNANYREYNGLFLSCKQIHDEMEWESLRLAPSIFRQFQEYDPDTALRIRPLRPTGFSSIMHVTIGVPRWALFSPKMQKKLHLSSVTIGIEDLESESDLYHLITGLDSREFMQYMDAHEQAPATSGGSVEKAMFYDIRTTYTDIIKFATKINCIVAPQLCDGRHNDENHWCIRSHSFHSPINIACNVRKVILRLKKLHDEVICYCGSRPHGVYPFNSVRLRWSPTDEIRQLNKCGWGSCWTDDYGKYRLFSKQNPAQFIWYRKPEKKAGKVINTIKGMLKV